MKFDRDPRLAVAGVDGVVVAQTPPVPRGRHIVVVERVVESLQKRWSALRRRGHPF